MFSRFRAKEEVRANVAAGSTNPTVMLLLKHGMSPDKKQLFEMLTTRYRGADGAAPLVTLAAAQGVDCLIEFAGVRVAISRVDRPLPDEWRQIATPGRILHWPNAQADCAQHRAHLIVALVGEPPNLSVGARVLTCVAGAICALYPDVVIAGLWGAQVLNTCESWAKNSAFAMHRYPDLPTDLWVSQHRFSVEGASGVGVLTQGLSRFVGRELELTAESDDLKTLLERSFGLTGYLLQNGPVLKDGSTFGISETERIAVRLCVSDRFAGLQVIAGRVEAV